jgi:ABC-type nitrate/sulfonate/bicarbonate transport system substrate-binding protein
MSTMRNRCAFAAVFALLLAWQTPPAAAQPIDFKAGIAGASNSVLAWWMAQAGGFYAQQGLRVELVDAGGNRGLEALQSGGLDVMHRGLSNIVRVNRSGGDLRLIGSTFFAAHLSSPHAPSRGSRPGRARLPLLR